MRCFCLISNKVHAKRIGIEATMGSIYLTEPFTGEAMQNNNVITEGMKIIKDPYDFN